MYDHSILMLLTCLHDVDLSSDTDTSEHHSIRMSVVLSPGQRSLASSVGRGGCGGGGGAG